MTNNEFLPEDVEHTKKERPYLKFQEGDTKIRIVSRPIAGWIDWIDKKPLRFRPKNKPASSQDPTKEVKAFWAMVVWNYANEKVMLLEVTQGSILKALTNLGADPDWGNFTNYDIKVTKKGSGLKTEYSVMPLAPKPLSEAAMKAIALEPINLEALYEGKDPWEKSSGAPSKVEAIPSALSVAQLEHLQELFDHDQDGGKKILEHLKVKDIFSIKPADFDKCVTALTKRKEAKNGSAKVA